MLNYFVYLSGFGVVLAEQNILTVAVLEFWPIPMNTRVCIRVTPETRDYVGRIRVNINFDVSTSISLRYN